MFQKCASLMIQQMDTEQTVKAETNDAKEATEVWNPSDDVTQNWGRPGMSLILFAILLS